MTFVLLGSILLPLCVLAGIAVLCIAEAMFGEPPKVCRDYEVSSMASEPDTTIRGERTPSTRASHSQELSSV